MKPHLHLRILFFVGVALVITHVAHAFYDPTIGRWLSMDPIDQPKSTSGYEYCDNDPVNKVDPDGCQAVAGMPYAPAQTYMYGDPYQASMANRGIAMREKAQLKQFGKDGVLIGGVAASAFGGEVVLGLYEAGSLGGGAIGTTNLILANSGLGLTVGVGSNAANQLIDTGKVSAKQLIVPAATGLVFGGISGGLGRYTISLATDASEKEAQAAFAWATGRYFGATGAELDAADVSAAQALYGAAAQIAAIRTVDTYVSPFVEESVDDFLKEKLRLDYEDSSNANRKGCGN